MGSHSSECAGTLQDIRSLRVQQHEGVAPLQLPPAALFTPRCAAWPLKTRLRSLINYLLIRHSAAITLWTLLLEVLQLTAILLVWALQHLLAEAMQTVVSAVADTYLLCRPGVPVVSAELEAMVATARAPAQSAAAAQPSSGHSAAAAKPAGELQWQARLCWCWSAWL